MDRMTDLIEQDLTAIKESDSELNIKDFKLKCLIAELLLDIREELRHIKRSQGNIKWSPKL